MSSNSPKSTQTWVRANDSIYVARSWIDGRKNLKNSLTDQATRETNTLVEEENKQEENNERDEKDDSQRQPTVLAWNKMLCVNL